MLIFSIYDSTLAALKPWALNGHECVAVDILHPEGWSDSPVEGIKLWGGLAKDFPGLGRAPDIVMTWPPCTHLALSGARWWKSKGPEVLKDAMLQISVARRWCEAAKVGGFIENPVGRLSTLWRKPDIYWHPHQFARYKGGETDLYTKKTGLWMFGNIKFPELKPLPPDPAQKNRITNAPGWDKKKQKALRWATPKGFAQAFYEANSGSRSEP